MRKTLQIRDRTIGDGKPTFVIAEIGVNHDGSVNRALELVEIAGRCGADGVKLQVFKASQLMHRSSEFATYQKAQCDQADPQEMLRKYELDEEQVRQVVDAIVKQGMVALATPFSIEDVGMIEAIDLAAVKIASPDLVNLPLLRRCAALGRPMLISTGAATMDEVARCAGWLREMGTGFAFLHCISSYPVAAETANLGWISELREAFDVPVGYSDHSTETIAGALAVSGGACIVEKHLTYDRTATGPDHAASADPRQFAAYVEAIHLADRMCGEPGKKVLAAEEDVRRVSRQSLVTCRELSEGQIIAPSDLIVQRPGTGISAARFDSVVGRRAGRSIAAGTLLQEGMLRNA
jgi:N,N'-diacetyllegionaminate synthase